MTHEEYDQHIEKFMTEMCEVTLAKNADYCAGTDEAMNDYYAAAEATGVDLIQPRIFRG